jgi:hypothetical protein
MRRTVLAAAALTAAWASSSAAQEVFAGAFSHATDWNLGAGVEEHGTDVELGLRSARLQGLKAVGRPMTYVLASKNLNARTNFAAVGLLWRRNFNRRLYGQLGFGLAIHDGSVGPTDNPGQGDRIVWGSRILFEPEAAIGLRLGRRWGLEAAYVHTSNGHLWTRINPGRDQFGVRIVRGF